MSELGELAESIVDTELEFLTGDARLSAISSASGWLTYNLGQLNNRIFSSFSGENPSLNLEEQSIYKSMYLSKYFKDRAASILRNMDSSNGEWLMLKEGDSQIQLPNKNEISKTYRNMYRDYEDQIKTLVTSYLQFQAEPRAIHLTCRAISDGETTSEETVSSSSVSILGVMQYTISVPVNQSYVYITFPTELSSTPSGMNVTLLKPENVSDNITWNPVVSSITTTGFRVDFGATIDVSGYRVTYSLEQGI